MNTRHEKTEKAGGKRETERHEKTVRRFGHAMPNVLWLMDMNAEHTQASIPGNLGKLNAAALPMPISMI